VKLPHIGHGIGLRRQHYQEVLDGAPDVNWFEIITENFLVPGGNPRHVLRKVRERFPVVMHGVSLSIGSVDPLDERYLDAVAALAAEIEPAWISDHLCWGTFGGRNSHDLLPVPFTAEALDHIVARVGRVQEKLGRQILLENVSSYATFAASEMSEWEFLSELARRADCKLLVDVNNIFVSAHNHGFDARQFLAGIPVERVAQLHLAGHVESGDLLLDTHDHPVREEVWDLLATAFERFGPMPTLVEWDENVPPLATLVAEKNRAAAVEARVLVCHG
jgi:uncharacterized protein (UPF0276 family)